MLKTSAEWCVICGMRKTSKPIRTAINVANIGLKLVFQRTLFYGQ